MVSSVFLAQNILHRAPIASALPDWNRAGVNASGSSSPDVTDATVDATDAAVVELAGVCDYKTVHSVKIQHQHLAQGKKLRLLRLPT